jgi:NitT/TauT family transport system permease protein
MAETLAMFAPNRVISKTSVRIMVVGQLVVFLLWWSFLTPVVIPRWWEIGRAIPDLWNGGIAESLGTSLLLYIEAVALATVFSMLLSYAAALAFFRPLASGWSKLRFLGMTGLPFFFTLYLHGVHELKLALLAFSVSVFLVTGMLDALDSIPKEKYDLARTLRMGEWETLWEVMVLGRIDVAFDVIRSNAAIGWMMLGMVEGLFRSEGGIGTVLVTQDKHFHLAEVGAILCSILILGLVQDYIFGVVKECCCPYVKLILERR